MRLLKLGLSAALVAFFAFASGAVAQSVVKPCTVEACCALSPTLCARTEGETLEDVSSRAGFWASCYRLVWENNMVALEGRIDEARQVLRSPSAACRTGRSSASRCFGDPEYVERLVAAFERSQESWAQHQQANCTFLATEAEGGGRADQAGIGCECRMVFDRVLEIQRLLGRD